MKLTESDIEQIANDMESYPAGHGSDWGIGPMVYDGMLAAESCIAEYG